MGTSGTYFEEVGRPSLFFLNGTYHLFASTRNSTLFSIGHATSPDLVNWIWDASPALVPAATGWDAQRVESPWVILDGGGAGFLMYYNGINGSSTQIGVATSNDLSNWTAYSGNPVLNATAGAWDSWAAAYPVAALENGSFKMWYSGRSISMNTNNSVGYATSPDGFNWTKFSGNPVINYTASSVTPNGLWVNSVRRYGDSLFALLQCRSFAWRMCAATSSDGISWSVAGQQILARSPSGWDSEFDLGGDTLLVNGSLAILYVGSRWGGASDALGIAYADFVQGSLSGSIDLGSQAPRQFNSLSLDVTGPPDATVAFAVRTSPDGLNWTIYQNLTSGNLSGIAATRFLGWDLALNGTAGSTAPRYAGFTLGTMSYIANGRYESAVQFDQTDVVGVSVTVAGDTARGSIVLEASSDNGTSWQRVNNGSMASVASPGTEFLYAILLEGTPSETPVIDSVNFTLQRYGFPENVTVRLGTSGTPFFNWSGVLDVTVNVSIPPAAFNTIIQVTLNQTPSASTVDIPFVVTSSHFGVVELSQPRYTFVLKNPLFAAFSPNTSSVSMPENSTMSFQVNASSYPPETKVNISWSLDGVAIPAFRDAPQFNWTSDFLSAGNHTILCEVENGDFWINRTWVVIVININRPPVLQNATPADPVVVSHAAPTRFSVFATDPDGEALEYAWTVDGVPIVGNGSMADVTNLVPGLRNLSVEISDPWSTLVVAWSVTATNADPRFLSLDPSGDFNLSHAAARAVASYVQDDDGEALNFVWSIDGTPISGSGGATHIVANLPIGGHTLRLVVSDRFSSIQATWRINSTNAAPVIVAASSPASREVSYRAGVNLAVSLADADGDRISVEWTVDSIAQGSDSWFLELSPVGLGTHRVALTATDGFARISIEWTINGTNSPPIIANAIPAIPANLSFVDVGSFFVQAVDADGDTLDYTWTLGLAPIANGTTSILVGPLALGTYELRVTVADGNATTFHTFSITVANTPPEFLSANPPTGVQVAHTQAMVFSIEAADHEGETLRYQWLLDGEKAAGSANSTTLGPLSAGAHSVRVVVHDASGSSEWGWEVHSVDDAPIVLGFAPTALTIVVSVGGEVTFSVRAVDPEGDEIALRWSRDNRPWGDGGNISTNWSSPGEHSVTVDIITAGHRASIRWNITVVSRIDVASIRSTWPAAQEVKVVSGNVATFVVTVREDGATATAVKWYLDGDLMGQGEVFAYSPSSGGAGSHNLTAVVEDRGTQAAARTWIVTVEEPPSPQGSGLGDLATALLGLVAGAVVGLMAMRILPKRRRGL